MPDQLKPKIPLYRQTLAEILETLLPPCDELSLPVWYYEEEDFESIGNTESENSFQFRNPTPNYLDSASISDSLDETFTYLDERSLAPSQFLPIFERELEPFSSIEERLSLTNTVIPTLGQELGTFTNLDEQLSQLNSMEDFKAEEDPTLSSRTSHELAASAIPHLSIAAELSPSAHQSNLVQAPTRVPIAPVMYTLSSPDRPSVPFPPDAQRQFRMLPVLFQDDYEGNDVPSSPSPAHIQGRAFSKRSSSAPPSTRY